VKSYSINDSKFKETNMNLSKKLYRDIMTGLFFMSGIFSLFTGQFELSTLLFGTASLTRNLDEAKPARA
jgi:hypothetical protein